jgi:chemotaxis protein CheX
VQDDISDIATSIWEMLFAVPLERVGPGQSLEDRVVTGLVTVDGAWQGAVMLCCDQTLAESLAGELFASNAPVTEDEVRDTVGEVTNMLAGNIKAMLPDPSWISLPAVAMGAHRELTVVGTTQTAAVRFRCGTGTVEVSVHQGPVGEGRS